jgi:hypothetical protein
MDKVSVATFPAALNETRAFKFGDKVSHLLRHENTLEYLATKREVNLKKRGKTRRLTHKVPKVLSVSTASIALIPSVQRLRFSLEVWKRAVNSVMDERGRGSGRIKSAFHRINLQRQSAIHEYPILTFAFLCALRAPLKGVLK